MDLVIEGRAYIRQRLVQCCIGIENGRIRSIKKVLRGETHLDFGDMLVLPAAIDPHVHFRDPGLTKKEDFQTGTISAAFGGVSCVLDMPNTLPPTLTPRSLEEKAGTASRKAWVDYGLIGGCSPRADPAAISEGVAAYKLFMSSTTGNLLVTHDADISKIISSVARTEKVLCVHAEDEKMIRAARATSLNEHDRNRPSTAEASAIVRLSKVQGAGKIHICHLSSKEGLAAAEKLPFTKEVAPHHLLLDKRSKLRTYGKANPPLRGKEDREAVYEAFRSGRIDVLASDHAPHTIEEKEQEFADAPAGMPGVETCLPLMLALVKKDRLSLDVLMRAACERPADIFGINKGRIEVGRDADLIVVNGTSMRTISAKGLHSKCGWTPFEGWDAIFPLATFVRGARIVEEGGLVGERIGRDIVVRKR
ncbi:MAG: dihydroorotase [Methanomassiliicoccales archaeon]|nr:dihydroorotase [Methanomassiliicoccales archaeon]